MDSLLGTVRRRVVTGAVVSACVLAAILLIVLLPASGPAPGTRARQYLSFSACLLTDAHGLAGPQAAQAWAGMEAASQATRARVEYLPVLAARTPAGALPYLASLVQRRCGVVVAVGAAQVSAVAADARRFATIRYVVVGGHIAAPNVTVVTPRAGQLRGPVAQAVTSAIQAGTA
jgi:hypothetical protein